MAVSRDKEAGLAAARIEQELIMFAEAVTDMAKAHTKGNEQRLRLGQLYHEITARTTIDYAALDAHMVQAHQVQLPSKSTMNRLRTVYETWCVHAGVQIEELAPFSITLLHQVGIITPITAKTAPLWLARMRAGTRDQVMAFARGMVDEDATRPRLVNLVVPEGVATMLADARVHFAAAVGEDKLSTTAFVEFAAQLVLDSSPENLRALWRHAHGEDDDATEG